MNGVLLAAAVTLLGQAPVRYTYPTTPTRWVYTTPATQVRTPTRLVYNTTPTQRVYQPQQVYYQQPTYTQQPAQVQYSGGDSYGFTAWLNGVRAQYGLRPVGYDANLESWAAANSAQQAARGLGHFVMGPARRQNAAMGNSASIGNQWMASPAHRAAMLDPTITRIGLAGNGSYWTMNAY